MFWGLIMEPQRRYSQTVKKSFHVSMAALDITNASDEPTQVICTFDGRNYLLCTLQKDKDLQVGLDLNFEEGDKVCFATNGKTNVHLTGYLVDDYDDNLDDTEDAGIEDEVNESDVPKTRKRQSLEKNSSPPKKKSKTLELLAAVDSQKESDSDDSDYNLSDALAEEDDDGDVDTTQVEEEEDDDEEEGDEEESDEDEEVEGEDEEESSSLSEDEPVEKSTPAKINGVSKKKDQKQKEAKKEVPLTPASQQQKEKKQKTPKSESVKQQQGKGDKTPKDENKSPAKPAESPKVQKRTLEGGVLIEEIKQGNGPVAKAGRVVQVYYEGRFKNNNKLFDSTTKGPGFKFRLGRQEVIKGWDVGVVGMKVGGKRRITCPPNMAYGQKGSPPAIPPNSTLVFEVELKNVN